ncbi:hypothetical protein [Prosthecobacter sp.]|uniref:hypothetical protein n=1 Tax=Prosthecobacter sp. TaxID=1965333 RepID=UPI001DEB6DD7|nr:hypothetical protein [Prosthecobacter sp.]MCB1276020.1 hypothetical protein [Prosthecobacter sp.]
MNRRAFIASTLAVSVYRPLVAADAATAAEQAHSEIWRRFIDKYGIMIDFADMDGKVSLPTPEECREGKPNALGWWAPIENGAMFNGFYMDAAVLRWKRTKSADDAAKARKLMEGLLILNSISDVKGFVGRGVSTDGKSHYPMGSNDQTLPWFLGLWRYWESGIATDEEKQRITKHLVETTEEIMRLGWKMPAEAPFGTRGSFEGFHFEETSRKLFVMKMLYAVTGDAKWQTMYLAELDARGGEKNESKRELCIGGMKFFYARTHNWTSCGGVSALRGLWELETDAALKADYAKGLVASAKLAAESLPLAQQWDNADTSYFEMNWRVMNAEWKPQTTEKESQELAQQQLKNFRKLAPRRGKETAFIREPSAAAWNVMLCPDADVLKQFAPEIKKLIAHFDYTKLYYSQFFWVEAAWERLLLLKAQ